MVRLSERSRRREVPSSREIWWDELGAIDDDVDTDADAGVASDVGLNEGSDADVAIIMSLMMKKRDGQVNKNK